MRSSSVARDVTFERWMPGGRADGLVSAGGLEAGTADDAAGV
jgi:hypothetical protein